MTKDEKIKLMQKKEKQIVDILLEEDMTYGMAKSIIQRIEADLLKDGSAFLNKSFFKNVYVSCDKNQHYYLSIQE